MRISAHQAKYFAHELICRKSGDDVERLSSSLFDAKVDLNPHQIDAALFALKNPLQEGVMLADEVGLGKTIEAGLVLCQLWAERKRRLLVVCPASLRKQWAQELNDKFALQAQVVDKNALKAYDGSLPRYLHECPPHVMVISYPFAARHADTLAIEHFDCVVLDEAHKLRNAHKSSNKTGQALRRAFRGRKKILLTATPLQNSLMELYGLSTLLDEYLFGDEKLFRKQFISQNNTGELQTRLSNFVKRTLRKDVTEYIRYTRRHTLTQRFTPTDAEHALYEQINAFLQREQSYALPRSQRHLLGLILRKLLASSPLAVADTLNTIAGRLNNLQQSAVSTDLFEHIATEEEDFSSDYDDWEEDETQNNEQNEMPSESAINIPALQAELTEIRQFITHAHNLSTDSKATALLQALQSGFAKMRELGAPQKVIVFTESVRTQQYLFDFLNQHGYQDRMVLFSGSNNHLHANTAYRQWLTTHEGSDRITGSPAVDKRSALIDHFKEHAQIMIATEAAAEGVNLQFCSLLINYDLPWNPQRIEQRIGRCHRYGQKFDVVVINFLNERNEADKRVLELLSEKFNLFDGVFGASDEILGRIESGLDFEKRIAKIYDTCRTPHDIQAEFDQLQQELQTDIQAAMQKTNHQLLDHFDEDVHDRLKLQLNVSQDRLNHISRWFWLLTRHALANHADFDETHKSFHLHSLPAPHLPPGLYRLLHQNQPLNGVWHDYRLSHPLGEWCIEHSLNADTPPAFLTFDYQHHPTRISVLQQKQGQSGWLQLDKIHFQSEAEHKEQLLFTARSDDGEWLDEDFCRKLLSLSIAANERADNVPADIAANAAQAVSAAIAKQAEQEHRLLKQESERLEKWAQDKIAAVKQTLDDTGEQLQQAKREKRHAATLTELAECEQKVKELEQKRRRLRQKMNDDEDEIEQQRDELIDAINAKLQQRSDSSKVFCLRWRIV
ncbi:SNF2-related protein [Uruburuella testudinis]|uniref:SNF2-related protein n=1 Tax=Uruburuella testudinis TaxID=1282863 RepID=A0ABY4DRX3_9NEIS|nr:SNF2-related protein [Uruburuella testudinis]UOO81784.1 SNF2-related protein [Uruburuella testudinis]